MKRSTATTAPVLLAMTLALLVGSPAGADEPMSPRVTPRAGVFGSPLAVEDWPLPTGGAGLAAATQGPTHGQGGLVAWNGALWFSEEEANQVGRIDTSGVITELGVPSPMGRPGYGPTQLSSAGDNGLWFLTDGDPLDGRATHLDASGTIVGYHDVPGYLRFGSIAATADGRAWITNGSGEGVSLLAPDGSATDFANARYDNDTESAIGSDGAFWFSDGWAKIQRIDYEGTLTTHAATGSGDEIVSMTASGDSVWYSKFNPGSMVTSSTGGVVAKMSTAGVSTPFVSPYPDLRPAALTPGDGGSVWFTTHLGAGVGHLSPSGVYRVAMMPEGHHADSVAIGPDGHLWYTDAQLNRVGRITMGDFAAAIASQTSTSPGSGTGLAPGQARVTTARTVLRKARAKLAVRCGTGGTACKGKIRVSLPKAGKAGKAGRAGKPLAKGRYALRAGARKAVKLTLTKAGTQFFRKRLKARLVVTLIGATGQRSTTRVTFRRR